MRALAHESAVVNAPAAFGGVARHEEGCEVDMCGLIFGFCECGFHCRCVDRNQIVGALAYLNLKIVVVAGDTCQLHFAVGVGLAVLYGTQFSVAPVEFGEEFEILVCLEIESAGVNGGVFGSGGDAGGIIERPSPGSGFAGEPKKVGTFLSVCANGCGSCCSNSKNQSGKISHVIIFRFDNILRVVSTKLHN